MHRPALHQEKTVFAFGLKFTTNVHIGLLVVVAGRKPYSASYLTQQNYFRELLMIWCRYLLTCWNSLLHLCTLVRDFWFPEIEVLSLSAVYILIHKETRSPYSAHWLPSLLHPLCSKRRNNTHMKIIMLVQPQGDYKMHFCRILLRHELWTSTFTSTFIKLIRSCKTSHQL